MAHDEVDLGTLIGEALDAAQVARKADSLERIYEASRLGLLRFAAHKLHAYPILRGRLSEEDLVSMVWTKVIEEIGKGRSAAEMFGWLRRNLEQRFIDALRRETCGARDVGRERQPADDARAAFDPADPSLTPGSAAIRDERRRRLLAAIDDLKRDPTRDQANWRRGEVLRLRHVEGLSNNAAAAELGLSAPQASAYYGEGLEHVTRVLRAQSGLSNPADA